MEEFLDWEHAACAAPASIFPSCNNKKEIRKSNTYLALHRSRKLTELLLPFSPFLFVHDHRLLLLAELAVLVVLPAVDGLRKKLRLLPTTSSSSSSSSS